MQIKLVGGLVIALILSGCTWVKLTDAGSDVMLVEGKDVSDCRLVGKTRSITKDSVARINRDDHKVATETATIARNEAARMGGDTIVPTGPVAEGEQEFMVYDCNGSTPK